MEYNTNWQFKFQKPTIKIYAYLSLCQIYYKAYIDLRKTLLQYNGDLINI